MKTMYRVVLIVDELYGEKLRSLPLSSPFWVVDSEANMEIVRELWKERKAPTQADMVTSFRHDPALSPEKQAECIVETIELHHGFHSVDPAMNILEIVGVSQYESLIRKLSRMGFNLSYVDETKPSLEFLRADE